jgi:dolichol-phosphate mannosyltransferase
MPKRALVTGANGFVGSVLARELTGDGHDVHLLVRPGSDRWRLDDLDIPRHEVDITDAAGLAVALERIRPQWIFHLATHGAYPSQSDRQRMAAVNILGTMNLVEAALELGFEALVNTGSSSEYGFTDHPPSEDERAEPNSDYAVTKLSQTLFCRFVARQHDVHIPTLRLYSVYGPYEEPSRLIPTLIAHGLAGRLPPLASPDIARDFVYTDDVVRAYLLAAERTGGERGAIYNVGTGTQTTLADAVDLAQRTFALSAEPEWQTMSDRTWDTTTWIANVAKIENELGWTAKVPFEAGFRRFAEWIDTGPARYRV